MLTEEQLRKIICIFSESDKVPLQEKLLRKSATV